MSDKTIFEEFYGPSIESEISGQESFLGLIGFVGGTALITYGIYKMFKDGINEVKSRIQKKKGRRR